MVRTTDLIENYKPIEQKGETYIVRWGYTPMIDREYKVNEQGELVLDEQGNPIVISETESKVLATWCVERYYYKPSEQELQNTILKWYNDEIDRHILQDFVWKDMKVWLSQENQFNYKAAYDLAVQTNGANLPIKFKFESFGNTKYYEFNTVEELADFYTSAMKFIQETLAKGWKEKDVIDWNSYKI